MEDRPCEGATGVHISHGAQPPTDRSDTSVNNDQNRCQLQHEKTPTEKTENGKINGTLKEGEGTPTSFNPDNSPHPANSNGNRHLLETNLKPKPSRRVFLADSTAERKSRINSRNSMDFRNDKSSELKTIEGKKEVLSTLNGVVSLHSVPLTNGYPGKTGADNDGSGSESGYTTPKKRRAQRNGKAGDNVTPSTQGKAMQQGNKQDYESAAPDSADRASQVESGRAGSKAEGNIGCHLKAKEPPTSATPPPLPAAELQRKNSDSKATGKKFEERSSKVKVATATKEDSWTLFKPPPVFPVDNSSAKIVPKISYASKVKENLNKTAQTGAEALAPAPQVPGRPPQVPMSAVKTITSASFTNGPLLGEGNGCPLPGPHFSSTASTGPLLVSPAVPAENVASTPGGSNTAVGSSTISSTEPRKASLFVYPNMQLSLPSGRQVDPPAAPSNQKSLGDIFQNQWGLSFINEPSAGPEGVACRSNGKDVPVEVSFQADCPVTVVAQTSGTSQPPFPKAHEQEKRTNAQSLSRGAAAAIGSVPDTSVLDLEAQKDETGLHGAIVFCSSSKDVCAELPLTSPAAPKVALAKDQGLIKGFDRRSSWASFDLKAAVIYHTNEMEYILNLQKQDPNRVVLYSESWDGPAQ